MQPVNWRREGEPHPGARVERPAKAFELDRIVEQRVQLRDGLLALVDPAELTRKREGRREPGVDRGPWPQWPRLCEHIESGLQPARCLERGRKRDPTAELVRLEVDRALGARDRAVRPTGSECHRRVLVPRGSVIRAAAERRLEGLERLGPAALRPAQAPELLERGRVAGAG